MQYFLPYIRYKKEGKEVGRNMKEWSLYISYCILYNSMANFVDEIKKTFSGLFGKGEDPISVGIDIGTSAIKVVELRKEDNKIVLTTYSSLALGQYIEKGFLGQVTNLPIEGLSQALIDTLRETKITSQQVLVNIPAVSSIIFTIDLPSVVEEKEYTIVIPNESKKFIPVPLTDVILDWYPLPRREHSVGQSKRVIENGGEAMKTVLVVATLNESVSKISQVLQKSGLPTQNLEIEMFSHIRSIIYRELFPVLILDIGASRSRASIVDHGIIEAFRLISKGGQDMTLALSRACEIPFDSAEKLKKDQGLTFSSLYPKNVDILQAEYHDIFLQANSTIVGYEKKYGKTVEKIILTGGGANAKNLLEYAQTQFSAEVRLARPFDKIETPPFLKEVLFETGPEFSGAIGLALRKFQ
jgi:type IV pilus assembly protein PilM